jgi:RNA polymerase sigma-70 factor, ECF subfamily
VEVSLNLTEKALRDFELVQSARQNNNQQAYTQLMKLYRDSIYFMLLKMTNNTTDAEDLTIEAFGKAFKKLDQYTPNYAFSTWLFKIASNNCIDYIRKQKKRALANANSTNEENNLDLAQNIPSKGLDPEEHFIKAQKKEKVRAVVEKLKPHYKKLIELRYFEEYSYEEIAKKLDLPLGTVKAQLFRAREFLYNIVKDKNI